MPKSRGRKRKQRRERGGAGRLLGLDWEMLGVMQAADEAEARGDALTALEVIDSRPFGSDGKLFWRPERVIRLEQLVTLRPYLPRWATSRWILVQAMQMLGPSVRTPHRKALATAVELRGGAAQLPGRDEVDAMVRVVDHDWVYRQLTLFEYGVLAAFLRTTATPDLVAGADRIQDWVHAPMRVLRFSGRSPRTEHWRDLSTGELVDVLDLGSAALLLPQECVLGRLVPTQDGPIFDCIPLLIPEDVAVDAANTPARWVEALQRADPGRLHTSILSGAGLLSDLPELVWQIVALQHAEYAGAGDVTAEDLPAATIGVVRDLLNETLEVAPDLVDPWACLGAALCHPAVLPHLDGAFTAAEGPGLRALAERLVGPAAEICRDLADSARDVA